MRFRETGTWRAGEEGQSRDDCIWRNDSIIGDSGTVLDDGKFAL